MNRLGFPEAPLTMAHSTRLLLPVSPQLDLTPLPRHPSPSAPHPLLGCWMDRAGGQGLQEDQPRTVMGRVHMDRGGQGAGQAGGPILWGSGSMKVGPEPRAEL